MRALSYHHHEDIGIESESSIPLIQNYDQDHDLELSTPPFHVTSSKMPSTENLKEGQDLSAQDRELAGEELGTKHGEPQIPIYSPVELLEHTDLSFAAILKGTAGNPLTPFEKKAALINAELDKFGLGRYQICIWFLCGFGYFLDLAWAQGVGLVATAIYQEMGVPDKNTGDIYALANAGLAIGALGFGLAVDVIGRKWAFNLTCLITSVFGLLLVR